MLTHDGRMKNFVGIKETIVFFRQNSHTDPCLGCDVSITMVYNSNNYGL